MKKLIILFLTSFLAFFFSACGNSSSNAGEVLDTGASYELLDNVITADSLKVDFGSNIVSKASLIVLNSNEMELENGLISELYIFDVADTCETPVTITFPLPAGMPDDEVLLLGIGVDYEFDSGKKERVFVYYEGSVMDSVVSFEFVPHDFYGDKMFLGASGSAKASNFRLYLGIFQDGCYYADGGHFKLWYPSGFVLDKESKITILDNLEKVYTYYKDLEYNVGLDVMNVHIKRNISEEGYYHTLGNDITLNVHFFEDGYQETVEPILYHEYFHYIQDNYDNTVFGNIWFAEATASYYESKILGSTFTGLTSEYFELQFESVIPQNNTALAGYARAPLIHFVSNMVGNDTWIKTLYENGFDDSDIESYFSELSVFFDLEYYEALALSTVGQYPTYTFHSLLSKNSYGKDVGASMILSAPSSAELKEVKENGGTLVFGTTEFSMQGTGGRIIAVTANKAFFAGVPDTARISSSAGEALTTMIRSKGTKSERLDTSIFVGEFLKSLDSGYVYSIVAVAQGTAKQSKDVSVNFTVSIPETPKEGAVYDIDYSGRWHFAGHTGSTMGDGTMTFSLSSSRPFLIDYQHSSSESLTYNLVFDGLSKQKPANINISALLSGTGRENGTDSSYAFTASLRGFVETDSDTISFGDASSLSYQFTKKCVLSIEYTDVFYDYWAYAITIGITDESDE